MGCGEGCLGCWAPGAGSAVPTGLVPAFAAYPGLTPWAILCRRSATGGGVVIAERFACGAWLVMSSFITSTGIYVFLD